MIFLFTDFGTRGPYVGQMKTVLAVQAADELVIDLMHDAPAFDPLASAHLLASLTAQLPDQSIIVAVVDPGVGDERREPCVLEADGRLFVGPNNGLFNVVAARSESHRIWRIDWQPEVLSASFHGRDLFAPVAARLAAGNRQGLTPSQLYQDGMDWQADVAQIIYIDDFGNAMTGIRAVNLAPSARIDCWGRRFDHARTFSDLPLGQGFWYANSNGLVELALNQASLAEELGVEIGDGIEICRD